MSVIYEVIDLVDQQSLMRAENDVRIRAKRKYEDILENLRGSLLGEENRMQPCLDKPRSADFLAAKRI
jgi:hypothetical protein